MAYYGIVLIAHSWGRWLVIILLLMSIVRAFQGWLAHQSIGRFDHLLNRFTLGALYGQMLMGYYLYLHSPIVDYFLQHIKESIPQTQLRFWGMEHITAMTFSILILSIGSYRAFHKTEDQKKFKTLALWFSFAFIIIFCTIPWSFSPFTARPDFRGF